MNSREITTLKLNPAMKECSQHQLRLHAAWEEAVNFASLKEDSTEELTDGQVRTLDQLIFRFGKLQDAIGTRLLPATLQLVQEWRDNEPFLDKLNRAEKLGILPSVEHWQLLRELRNQTAHEYPDQPERVRINLCRLIANVPILEDVYKQLVTWIEVHVLRVGK